MTFTTPRAVWTNDEGSMAQDTAATRWPQTIQNMIDDVQQTLHSGDNTRNVVEGAKILSQLLDFKQSVQSNQPLRPFPCETGEGTREYNLELQSLGRITWHAAPWLFAECYLYRYVQFLLDASETWKTYDIFKRQKEATFAQSQRAVEELAKRYEEVSRQGMPADEASAEILFEEMTQIALWGNATDLSLLVKLSLAEIQSLQGAAAIKKNQGNIIVNDMQAVWTYLRHREQVGQIDIVLDNSGFEFFTDLVYASYLLQSGLASSIILHVKAIPWFVSDVVFKDVQATMALLASPDVFPDRHGIARLLASLTADFSRGAIRIAEHSFWTRSASFHHLPAQAPDLMASLARSDLVIFKGDLNYRKLVDDSAWPYTTSFETALGPMGKGSGVKILSLRTNKADVCVGLESESHVAELNKVAPHLAWVRSGKYAVVSFNKGL